MSRSVRFPALVGCVSVFTILLIGSMVSWLACISGQPQLVFGPSVDVVFPTLEILQPTTSLDINQGERFSIRWTDTSPAEAPATISYFLEDTTTGIAYSLVSSIPASDDLAPDQINVTTAAVPFGTYYLRGEIDNAEVDPITVYAMTLEAPSARITITVGQPGTNPLSVPPQVVVVEPSFNQGVAQQDTLTVVVQPTANAAGTVPYDPDSDAQLYIVLDVDDDPTNDDVTLPQTGELIVLRSATIAEDEAAAQTFSIPIDLNAIPIRENGEPYFIRATIIDAGNRPVHSYADGVIFILRSATGTSVDLVNVGRNLSGAVFVGFNPGSLLGYRMTSVGDFDADGIGDFVLVARLGNPRNFGNIGEAYLVYGLDGIRFGGDLNVNSVSTSIPGAIIEAPPNRLASRRTDPQATPLGITSAASIPDISGDGRPELLFGLPMVDGMYQGRDHDPGDSDPDRPVVIRIQGDQVTRRFFATPDNPFGGTIDSSLEQELDDVILDGILDTYVSRAQPNTAFGEDITLRWQFDANNARDDLVTLVGYDLQLLATVFTTLNPNNINDLQVTYRLGTASTFEGRELLQPSFDESTTWSSFGPDGPQEGADFSADALERTGTVLDVTDLFQQLIDGELASSFPAWVIKSTPETAPAGQAPSSDNPQADARPLLQISYSETLPGEAYGCYQDLFVNNVTNEADDPGNGLTTDSTLESLGAAMVINSENRDAFGPSDQERLDNTVVALELTGQEEIGGGIGPNTLGSVEDPQLDGPIRQLARDSEVGLTRGVRITAGWYDFVNDGSTGDAQPRLDLFGMHVASIPDINNNSTPEIVISSPRNELYLSEIQLSSQESMADARMASSTRFAGSISVINGADYSNLGGFNDGDDNFTIPSWSIPGQGSCESVPLNRSGLNVPSERFEIFAEDINDMLGGAEYAGDVNLDGIPDIVCGAPMNDHPNGSVDTGAVYVLYLRTPIGNISLNKLDNPAQRPPTLRIRGQKAGDRIGSVQSRALDINGDRVDDVVFGSPTADFGDVRVSLCGDYNQNGALDNDDLRVDVFSNCRAQFGDEVFLDDSCKAYDFDNDRDIDDEDRNVFDCLVAGFTDCCPVDNGFVGVVFGNISRDGDRSIAQLATTDLPGIKFFGADPGDRAGNDVHSAGDFNRDGYGDLLISAPGKRFFDDNGRERLGVAYLIFGGTHLNGNRTFSLDQVGTESLPGIVFWSPFVAGRPDEAPIEFVGQLGDINNDGFDDIGLGIPHADFVDQAFPQDPTNPGNNPNTGRRPDDGNVYIIYGNNTGSNSLPN